MMTDERKCDVCGAITACDLINVPGVPISCMYCRECWDANAHPWGILVADTACGGGLDKLVVEWRHMVEDTCTRLGKTMEQFQTEVQETIENMDRYFEQLKATEGLECEEDQDEAVGKSFETDEGTVQRNK